MIHILMYTNLLQPFFAKIINPFTFTNTLSKLNRTTFTLKFQNIENHS